MTKSQHITNEHLGTSIDLEKYFAGQGYDEFKALFLEWLEADRP